jgi:hypothetical protein
MVDKCRPGDYIRHTKIDQATQDTTGTCATIANVSYVLLAVAH